MDLPIAYRPPTPEDVNFILSSWLKSYRQSPTARNIPDPIYFKHHKIRVQHTLSDALISVACNSEDHHQIYGYAVFSHDPHVLHYVYIKAPFRRYHIASDLLQHIFPSARDIIITHKNKNTPYLSKPFNFTFYPYL